MFNIDQKPLFTTPVKLADDAGSDFTATFELVDDETQESHDLTTAKGTKDFLKLVTVNVEGVVQEGNEPVPFTAALMDRMVSRPDIRAAMARAYFRAGREAIQGN